MRLYRGLKEPFRPENVGTDRVNGTDFTECPHTALLYARGRRGAVLVVDLPDDGSCRVSEELWLNSTAKRFMIWGRFDEHIVAAIPAKELRSQIRKKGVAVQSLEDKPALLRDYIDQLLASQLVLPRPSRTSYVSPHTGEDEGWEKRAANGEVWVDETNTAPAEMADHLLWVLREYSSRARSVHQACGALPFTLGARQTPPTIAWGFLLWFDLTLIDRKLIEERVRQRGGEVGAGPCPRYWLERGGFVLAAEAHEVVVPAGDAAAARETWKAATEIIRGVELDKLAPALASQEQGQLAAILVAVHEDPLPSSRPSREESLERHYALLDDLGPLGEASGLPISWNALWRLSAGLKVSVPGRAPWLRYPAVSFMAAVRPMGRGPARVRPTKLASVT